MSLWPVEDRSAARWMTALYENRLLNNLSTGDAVREATIAALRYRRATAPNAHPLHWGAFVATGEWR